MPPNKEVRNPKKIIIVNANAPYTIDGIPYNTSKDKRVKFANFESFFK